MTHYLYFSYNEKFALSYLLIIMLVFLIKLITCFSGLFYLYICISHLEYFIQ